VSEPMSEPCQLRVDTPQGERSIRVAPAGPRRKLTEVLRREGLGEGLRICPGGRGAMVRLRIPERSLLAYQPQVVSEFKLNVPRAHDPMCRWGARGSGRGSAGPAGAGQGVM